MYVCKKRIYKLTELAMGKAEGRPGGKVGRKEEKLLVLVVVVRCGAV